ncbi:hypothetical protein [Actinoalloteichus hymeniacidonis]|uniref:Uncharacterized protein n=1 Tax=Actinoalloteichus hymeniacidonis TaxID=340345 RepID=A0AAC9HT40_9PSEU|nr:hypothetical protein TL08_21585 [Actinoalloteichus hymeniacidonis]MBB5906817.1 hypothetical protein [Actinoalloteichus hymeniacidonis]
MVQRGSDKHGARLDDELSHEVEGMTRANRSVRAEEALTPEPPADDDPLVANRAHPEEPDEHPPPGE